MIDKAKMLDRIKEACELKSDAALARFLGIAPATLSNWRTRDSMNYDLVFSKCEHIDLHWLLTGQKHKATGDPGIISVPLTPGKEEVYKETLKENQKTIIQLSQEVGELKERIRQIQGGVEKEADAETFGVFGSAASSLDEVDPEQSILPEFPASQAPPYSLNKDF